jgi:undecaprenyl-diphosphatase
MASVLDVTGKVAKQPPFWVAAAGALAFTRQGRNRPAATRALAGYASAGVVANLVLKPIFGRDRPDGAGGRIGPLTSSFPSGHAACDTAFAVIAARRVPSLSVPMLALTTASHWSLWRTRQHYVSDILAGDAVGLALALAILRLWPTPSHPPGPTPSTAQAQDEGGRGDGPHHTEDDHEVEGVVVRQ